MNNDFITKWVVRCEARGDMYDYFFNNEEEAKKNAISDWNHLTDREKREQQIIFGRCETCIINEDGKIDYAENEAGWCLCDLADSHEIEEMTIEIKETGEELETVYTRADAQAFADSLKLSPDFDPDGLEVVSQYTRNKYDLYSDGDILFY